MSISQEDWKAALDACKEYRRQLDEGWQEMLAKDLAGRIARNLARIRDKSHILALKEMTENRDAWRKYAMDLYCSQQNKHLPTVNRPKEKLEWEI